MLLADTGAAFIPGVTGAGQGVKLMYAGEKRATQALLHHPGSRGGASHQQTILDRITELKCQGHEHLNGGNLAEERIPTPGGSKSYRRLDITTKDPGGNRYRENVGKRNKRGDPVSRERRALDDMERQRADVHDLLRTNKEY